MKTKVLVIDPEQNSAQLTRQMLEEIGYKHISIATSGQAAQAHVMRQTFDLVIIDSTLSDLPAPAVVHEIRHYTHNIPVIVALHGTAELPSSWSGVEIQGMLPKPFRTPDLRAMLEQAMIRQQTTSSSQPAGPRQPASGDWLKDVNKAAQYLTTLTLESSAEAALLTQGQQLYAYAGQFPQEEADELAQIVADNWDKADSQRAQVRFMRMSNGSDYLLYSTLTTGDIVLSLAFMAETPLRSIRQQARKLTEALLAGPQTTTRTPETPPTTNVNPAPEELTQWDAKLQPKPQPPAVDIDLGQSDDTPPADAPPGWKLPRKVDTAETAPTHEDTAPADWQEMPEEADDSTMVLSSSRKERIPGMPGVYRTPHGLYKLTYTFLWVPKLPDVSLEGDIVDRLAEWVHHLTLAYDWRVEHIDVQPSHVQITIACSPADSPETVVRTLIDETSNRVMEEFPRLAARHHAGKFWAPGYYVVTPGRRLKQDEIERYIEYQRREQGFP